MILLATKTFEFFHNDFTMMNCRLEDWLKKKKEEKKTLEEKEKKMTLLAFLLPFFFKFVRCCDTFYCRIGA